MSEDYKVDEEKIVALLLGELTEEEKSLVENAILQDSRLQEMESVLADTLRLVEKSSKDIFPITPLEDLKLSQDRKDKLFAEIEKEEVNEEESPESSTKKEKKHRRQAFLSNSFNTNCVMDLASLLAKVPPKNSLRAKYGGISTTSSSSTALSIHSGTYDGKGLGQSLNSKGTLVVSKGKDGLLDTSLLTRVGRQVNQI